MRSQFDKQLEQLNQELTEMGALCETIIAITSQSLTSGDKSLALRVPALDSEIDRKERAIESLCLKLLLQQQPVARDLRQISAALKMITDMERIGDQAADIAEIIGFLQCDVIHQSAHISEMAKSVIKMVNDSVEAFIHQNIALAQTVISEDDVVDRFFREVKSDLIQMIIDNPMEGEYALDLLMIAKYFERIGDHATNIAEWVLFSVTGVHRSDEFPAT